MKTMSFWSNKAGDEVTGREGVEQPSGDECVIPLYSIQAATYEEAMAIHHLRMGWNPYRPIGESSPCPKSGASYYPNVSYSLGYFGRSTIV